MSKISSKRESHEVSLRVFNSRGREITFNLEPWGETYPFHPGDEFLVIARGPAPGSPELDFEDDSVTASGWPGSTVRLFRNGDELGAQAKERTPIPEGR